jgi:hypothetical protein
MQHQEIKEVFLMFDGYDNIVPVASFTSKERALEFIQVNSKTCRYGFKLLVCPLDSRVYYDWRVDNGTS